MTDAAGFASYEYVRVRVATGEVHKLPMLDPLAVRAHHVVQRRRLFLGDVDEASLSVTGTAAACADCSVFGQRPFLVAVPRLPFGRSDAQIRRTPLSRFSICCRRFRNTRVHRGVMD